MRSLILITASWLIITGCQALAQPGEPPAALVFGDEIRCSDFRAHEPRACAAALLRRVHVQIMRDFAEQNALNATPVELNRLAEYNRAFERHDRAQRGHKLVELETRLASESLSTDERKRLENFRDVLIRLADFEADVDAGTEAREPIAPEILRGWVETVKANALLYSRYGGIVGVMAYGPYAHGALAKLTAEYMERGAIRVLDANVANFFQVALQAPPRIVHPKGEPDFTPFWERPITPSYIAH